ncbi:MAG: acetate--CoA ligase family protein, partial [Acidimicrobiia bacterium]
AVVGASEKLGMSNNAVLPMLDAGIAVRLVNPNRDSVYGLPASPSLAEIGEPIDAVLALVSAERSIEVIEQAAALGCGGVAVAAGGFTEMGDEGAALQARLIAAAGPDLAIVGPNCSGFMNVPLRMNLFTGGRISLTPGSIAVVSQSGFLVRSSLAAAKERQLGISVAVSSGNEAVCDLGDYIDVLADDPMTRVICLVIEKVRDPRSFFESVTRARAAGKAVVALKLGRSEASREIMKSHTGAIADEAWVYDVAFRQIGVLSAGDIDEMLDKAQLLAQLPPEKWKPINGVAVMASSGGVAGVAADASEGSGIKLAKLDRIREWVHARVPGEGTLNPLDMTGFVMRDRDLMAELFAGYASAPEVDALVLCWWAAEGDEGWSQTLLEPFASVATSIDTPLIVSPVEATAVGSWTTSFKDKGVSFCRGMSSTYRALAALDQVARAPRPGSRSLALPSRTAAPASMVATEAGAMLSFGAAMELLTSTGITVAPYVVLEAGVSTSPDIATLGEQVVVKLADVPHRTELGAVRVGVAQADVPAIVAELRAIARAHGESETVAVQKMVRGRGEAFLGIHGTTDLGPMILFGRGGVLVEVSKAIEGRLLPLADGDAEQLADDVAGPASFAGLRGQTPWPMDAMINAISGVGQVWDRCGGWLASADLNPLIVTDDGLIAVDALLIARD